MFSLFNKGRHQPSYVYSFVYLPYLDSNWTIFKDFCYSIWSLFLIILFPVDASHFHIYYISNCVVMLAGNNSCCFLTYQLLNNSFAQHQDLLILDLYLLTDLDDNLLSTSATMLSSEDICLRLGPNYLRMIFQCTPI